MTIRRTILGFAVALNLILLSLAVPVNHSATSPQAIPQLVADGIPLPPPVPPPPTKKG